MKSQASSIIMEDVFIHSINAPSPRFWYGAVLLPNQQVAYLGGYNIDYLPLYKNGSTLILSSESSSLVQAFSFEVLELNIPLF
ncbi:8405_t:CDS:2 [Funneliformis caledonium]|uniref:8405_t:CDS:1 n=1 Tax=Funneliformis caledonium TaxID=1117310 RepID=A0A9N9GK14_9GLOM|nr:8405_t:CDS:2 [Funneliformis caledonium]